MKLFLSTLLLSITIAASAQNMSSAKMWDTSFDTYQEAETLLNKGQRGQALKEFEAALNLFIEIKKEGLSGWQDKIVSYRINLCRTNIKALQSGGGSTPHQMEPSLKINTSKERNEKQRQSTQLVSVEKTLKLYMDKYNEEVRKTERLEKELSNQSRIISDSRTRNDKLELQIKELETSLTQLRTAHEKNLAINKETFETRIAILNTKLTKVTDDKVSAESLVEAKSNTIIESTKQVDRLKIQTNNLQSAVQLKDTAIANLKNKITTLESNLTASKETATKTQEYVTSQKLYISKLTSETEKLKQLIEDKQKKQKQLEDKLEKTSKENYDLKVLLQEKVNKLAKALEDIQGLTSERDKLTAQQLASDKAIKLIESEQVKDKRSLSQLSTANQKLQETVATQIASISELEKKYESVQRQLVENKASLSKAQFTSAGEKKIAAELLNRTNGLERRLVSANNSLKQKNQDFEKLNDQLTKAKETLKATLVKNRTLEQNILRMKSNQQGEQQELASFQAERATLVGDKNKLKKEIAENSSKLSKQQEDNSNLKMQIARLNMQLKTKDVDIAVLKEQLVKASGSANSIERPSTKAVKIPKVNSADSKNQFVGTLYPIKAKSKYITHALVDANKKTLCYLHFDKDASKYEGKKVSLSGKRRVVKGWTVPLISVTTIKQR